jgi:integrase
MRAYSEALELRWDDVDLTRGFVTVRSAPGRRTKSGKTRVVPMTARLRAALQAHAARFRLAQRPPFVFSHEVTRRSAVAGERIRSLRGSFAKAAKAAQLPDTFRAHDLRHRRVTTWLADSKSPVLVQSAMGHASISTTMGYSHLQAEHLRALVEERPAEIVSVVR